MGTEKPLAYKINNYITDREYKSKKIRSWGHPQSLNFLMIDRCNSSCVMCGGDYFGSKSDKLLTFDKYRAILKNLSMKKVGKVVFGGAGDPLLNKHLPEIVEYTAREHRHVRKRIITNAIALKEDLARVFLANDVDFTISINAATKETYRKIAQVDQFDNVYENVKRMSRLKQEMKSDSRLELSIVITRRNIEELPAFVDIAHDFGDLCIKVLYCRYYPQQLRFKKNDRKDNRLMEEESLFFHKELSNQCLKEAKERAKKHGIDFWSEPMFGVKVKAKQCYAPWKTIYIGFDGEVYPCAAGEVLFYERVKNGYYNTGNLLKENIRKVWNNDFYKRLRTTDVINNGQVCIDECACCGNSINWLGPDNVRSHILDWSRILGGQKETEGGR